ncbi:hypothetical protein J4479_02430 [Candidatus Woesearchaeota archaeon]|nr:hypothetical protein [Candidatus Woesearchaeota archaeon]
MNNPDSLLNQLVSDIKKKKELTTLKDAFVLERLRLLLTKNFKLNKKLGQLNPKSADYKKTVKLIRDDLRKSYGLFRIAAVDSLMSLVDKLSNPPQQEIIEKILKQHSSTKERQPYYSLLYPQLFAITGNPGTILDLGCGLNPFSIPFMKLKQLIYYAYDLSRPEIKAINQFFQIINLRGKAQLGDFTTVRSLPSVDIAFLFKMTDLLDQGRGHKKTEEILKRLTAKYVVISFATLTMSSQPMNAPRRRWVEWLCNRLNYSFSVIEIPTEIFYVIQKN